MTKEKEETHIVHICPFCQKEKLIIEDIINSDTPIELVNAASTNTANLFLKCGKCKHQIGILIKK